MHPLVTMGLYYGELDKDEYGYLQERQRATQTRVRRRKGIKPFAASPFRAHTPPCTNCEFKKLCEDKGLACNIFAEWTLSRREIPAGIKKLLPSKKWMKLTEQSEHLTPIRVAYYLQTGEKTADQTNQEEMFE
jgi:hypothetical protein